MASVVLTALGSGALGLMYGVASAPKQIVENLKSSDESLVKDCQDCLQYMQTNGGTDVDPRNLSNEQRTALQQCENVRLQPVNTLEGLLRGMMKGVDREKLSSLAQRCRGDQCTSHEEFVQEDEPFVEQDKAQETQESLNANEEYINANEEYIEYNGEWTDMSSFEYSDDDGSIVSGEEMMIQDML